ncbi:MAG: MotA/TolQ/ExbB proton channel family protein [Deltaproteobacteria bacterium]|nr:MotA/TolQ/ExbB proton channel family protein [Deltaproteobacteria bacterium]
MLIDIFLKVSLLGAQAVFYLLVALSVISVALIMERAWFYKQASKGLEEFRRKIRSAVERKEWEDARRYIEERKSSQGNSPIDMETELVSSMLASRTQAANSFYPKALEELSQDAILRSRLTWEENLVVLATIGNNAPFIGLFGTVLGIIKAFHTLSEQAEGTGMGTVTAGIAEALVATALGILVAIPAVMAFNFFQRRIKSALSEAEGLKSFLIAKILI